MHNSIILKVLEKLLQDTRIQKLKWENMFFASDLLRPLQYDKDYIFSSINKQLDLDLYIPFLHVVDMEHSYFTEITDGAFFLISVKYPHNLELRIQEQNKEYSEIIISTSATEDLKILSKIKELYNLIRFSKENTGNPDNSDFINNFLNS